MSNARGMLAGGVGVGVGGGVGEMLKFRFDRYITVESPAFAQPSSMNEDKIFHAGSMKKLVVETTIYEK